MTLSPSRSRSSVIAPSKVTTPFVTSTRTLARGAQSSLSSSAWMAALISASGCAPFSRGVAARSPLSRSEREITPTTLSPRSTGRRLMRRRIIRSTASLSSARLVNRLDVAGHHFPDLAPILVRVSLGEPPAAEQKVEPAGTLVLASKLAAAKEVALAQNPAQLVVGVEDERARSPASATLSRPPRRRSCSQARRSRHRSLRREPALSFSSDGAGPFVGERWERERR